MGSCGERVVSEYAFHALVWLFSFLVFVRGRLRIGFADVRARVGAYLDDAAVRDEAGGACIRVVWVLKRGQDRFFGEERLGTR